MDSRRRWTLLSVAMAGTLAAIFYPDGGNSDISEAVSAPSARQRTAAAPAPGGGAPSLLDRSSGWIAAVADPFAGKGWQPEPVVVPQAAIPPAAAPVAAIDLAPAPPPPLPFKFVGQMTDGSDRVVYLSNGDQVVIARQGDVLDGGYKVVAISPAHIEFELVSSGFKQPLAIPAKDN